MPKYKLKACIFFGIKIAYLLIKKHYYYLNIYKGEEVWFKSFKWLIQKKKRVVVVIANMNICAMLYNDSRIQKM